MIHNIAVRDTDLVSADVEAGEITELDLTGLSPPARVDLLHDPRTHGVGG